MSADPFVYVEGGAKAILVEPSEKTIYVLTDGGRACNKYRSVAVRCGCGRASVVIEDNEEGVPVVKTDERVECRR